LLFLEIFLAHRILNKNNLIIFWDQCHFVKILWSIANKHSTSNNEISMYIIFSQLLLIKNIKLIFCFFCFFSLAKSAMFKFDDDASRDETTPDVSGKI